MSKTSFQKLCEEGILRPSGSKEVNECIADIFQLGVDQMARAQNPLRDPLPPLPLQEFARCWSRFVAAVTMNFPDIEPFNLTAITTTMVAEERYQEELFLCQLIEALCPSCESMCFLGHAYRHLEEHFLALQCYQEAHRRGEHFCEERELEPGNPNWLDTADYLRYAAECQLALGLPADALMSLTRCVRIVREAGPYGVFKRNELTKLHQSAMEAAGWKHGGDLWEVPAEALVNA